MGMDLSAQGKILPGFPMTPEGPEWAFDGTPVVYRDRLYAAMRRRDNVGAQTYIACFDLEDGKRLWRRHVSGAETLGRGQWPELTHNLLTYDRGMLYFNTNQGVVAAIRAIDGEIRWLTKYPRAKGSINEPDNPGLHFFRDLTPCLHYQGMLIVAPSDSDQIFSLDVSTGQLIWSSGSHRATDVVHLLGASGDRLLISGEYLYWIDVYTGRVVGQFPSPTRLSPGHASPSPRGIGRGLLVKDQVYWPTQESVFVFQLRTRHTDRGWQPVMTRKIDLPARGVTGGNILISRGVLLIVGESRIVAFNSNGKKVKAEGSKPAASIHLE